RDRARDPQGPQHPDPGRGDLVAGHHLRAAGPGRPGAADAGPDHDRDRTPSLDHPPGGRDLRDRPGPGDRAGDPRGAADEEWLVRATVRATVPGSGDRARQRLAIAEEDEAVGEHEVGLKDVTEE